MAYLRDELDWPIEADSFEEAFFDFEPEEIGLDEEHAAKIKHIKQLRPLHAKQPWGIFFVEFEKKKLPVAVLRRILSHLVVKKRAKASKSQLASWQADDLLFVSAFGDEAASEREIAFAHFHQEHGDLPTLRVLGWDGGDTVLKLEHVDDDLHRHLRWPQNPTDLDTWRKQWSSPFRHRLNHVIRTADALAEILAALARRIRDAAKTLLKVESEKGQLRRLHKAFQTALIHDLTEDDFADTYAQTITYGLLTAAISRTEMSEGRHGTALIAENVTDMVPITNPFLREMLETFIKAGGRKGGIDFDELGIQDVVELLRGDETDLPAILRDFGNKTHDEDPVIHFYEHFLAAYNKKLKVQRGVFYTPQPVVSYIVRSVHELLQTKFGIEDGLASTITWGEMAVKHAGLKIPEGVKPTDAFVQVLDPATGTATFLVEVIDVIYKTLMVKWRKDGKTDRDIQRLWNDYVPNHLLPRLHGYELMMASYAIAHMKLPLKLQETGFTAWDKLGDKARARIYLTNALEPPQDFSDRLAFDAPALAHEAQAVNDIKRHMRFTVVIGNPPYSVTSFNFNSFIDSLMNDYKKHVRGEQGLVALADDYLKFIRLSQELLRGAGSGLWGMITNHGYLRGIIHRGVRKELLNQFSSLFILDLHGDSNIGERPPAGKRNENVFDIQQGVSISIGSRSVSSRPETIVRYSDLWGTRSEKYDDLARHSISDQIWVDLRPVEPRFFLIPFDDTNVAEYRAFPSLVDMMPVNSCGVKTHRDGLLIDFDKQDLVSRMSDVASERRLELLRERYQISDTPHWKLKEAQSKMEARDISKFIQRITYRPFDYRWIYYNPAIIEKGDSKYPTLRHLLGSNLGLLTARIQATGVFDAVFVSRYLVEMKTAESSRSCTVFPLFLNVDSKSPQTELLTSRREANFNPNVLNSLTQRLGMARREDLRLPEGFTPEDIFDYTYAVLHSPGYRSRYAQFLKIDFPRLPLTGSIELFRSLARLGGELVALHLTESPNLDKHITEFVGIRNPEVEKVTYAKNTVWVDKAQTAGFKGVPEPVWNFHIGGYQVCERWLKYRKGRKLTRADIDHYQKIVVALNETIRLMKQIDEVIDRHGGWPGAFSTSSSKAEAHPMAAEQEEEYRRST